MTRILTISSGAAMPKIARKASASPGLSLMASSDMNGARAAPSSEILAAPSRNAAQTWNGGPGRSSAAITSQSIKQGRRDGGGADDGGEGFKQVPFARKYDRYL